MLRDTRFQANPNQSDEYSILPVWQRIGAQIVIATLALSAIVLIGELANPSFDAPLQRLLSLALVPMPVLLWLYLSVLPEYSAARPRRRLIGVAVVSALTASAVGLPVVNEFFGVQQWLPLQSVFARILGYTVTAGIVDAGLKFLVLRYLIVPQGLRVRSDAVAYAFASAIGYSAFLNLALIWRLEPSWDIAAIYLLSNMTIQIASSLFIALGIIESYFSDAYPLVLPINVLAAAIISGIITALVGGFLSGPLSTAGNTDRPLFVFALLVAALTLSIGIAYFLYSNAERREREAFGSQWETDGI
jgi:hypothetical protein